MSRKFMFYLCAPTFFVYYLILGQETESRKNESLTYPQIEQKCISDSNASMIGHFNGQCLNVEIEGNIAYIDSYHDSLGHIIGDALIIIDISEPSIPLKIGSISLPSGGDIKIDGNYAYVAGRDSGFSIVDVSNPAHPQIISRYNILGTQTLGIDISGDYAYVAARDSGLRVIDISIPSNPTEIGFIRGLIAYQVLIKGNFAYIATGLTGVHIVDISNPLLPFEVAHIDTIHVHNLEFTGDYLITTGGLGGGCYITDISTPSNPQIILRYDVFIRAGSMSASFISNYIYIGHCTMGAGEFIEIHDFSNPMSPQMVGYCWAGSHPSDIDQSGIYFFEAGYFGLYIYRNDLLTQISDDKISVIQLSYILHQNYPNPFNPNTDNRVRSAKDQRG